MVPLITKFRGDNVGFTCPMPVVFQSGCLAAFLYVEGGERQVIWKPDRLVNPSRAHHGLGTTQLPTVPGQKRNKSSLPTDILYRRYGRCKRLIDKYGPILFVSSCLFSGQQIQR